MDYLEDQDGEYLGPKTCSFCGDDKSVDDLIEGTDSSICKSCVEVCNDILKIQDGYFDEPVDRTELPYTLTPSKIKQFLDNHVIAQDTAKQILSVGAYNHYKRIKARATNQGISIEKSNILMLGPSGVGKTLIAKTLSKILGVPFAIADATKFTEAGYVGDDVESMITTLYRNSGNSLEKTQNGIIYIDEIDKIAGQKASNSSGRDISGEGVQQALLKIIEGSDVEVKDTSKGSYANKSITINTENILFVCAGAFPGIDRSEDKSAPQNNTMGFLTNHSDKAPLLVKNKHDIESNVLRLIDYGLIPEFIGRFPVVAKLHKLNQEHYCKILLEPENSILRQFQELFSFDDKELIFTEPSVNKIAELAQGLSTGARSLRTFVEGLLLEPMYTLPDMPHINTVTLDWSVSSDKFEVILS